MEKLGNAVAAKILAIHDDMDKIRKTRQALLHLLQSGESLSPTLLELDAKMNTLIIRLSDELAQLLNPVVSVLLKQYEDGLLTTDELVSSMQFSTLCGHIALQQNASIG